VRIHILKLLLLCIHSYSAAKEPISLNILPRNDNEHPLRTTVRWTNPEKRWVLEHSYDLRSWRHVDASGYRAEDNEIFLWTNEHPDTTSFYRARKIGQHSLYVVGDSISTRSTWPLNLSQASQRKVFSQAVGGTRSPSMVARALGVELAHIGKPHAIDGRLHVDLHWRRHIADRSQSVRYRSLWPEYVKTVSEPESIEVYVDGVFNGCASRKTRFFSTDYASYPSRIFSAGHGLSDGDQVVFLSGDPAYPQDLEVSSGKESWAFSSSNLPPAVVEKRVYFVTSATADSFEIKELSSDTVSLKLGGNASPNAHIECGWTTRVPIRSTESIITWRARTRYDDWIWLLEVSANDIPGHDAGTYTIPNIDKLIGQMREIDPRYLIITPPIGSQPHRGPGTFNWTNYHHSYLPLVHQRYGDRVVDTQSLMNPQRTAEELSFLNNPEVPELLWIAGTPTNNDTWKSSREPFDGANQQWVGPGFTPLQFRTSFADSIHLGKLGNQLISEKINSIINEKGW
jgi:hypothetical protein